MCRSMLKCFQPALAGALPEARKAKAASATDPRAITGSG
jgi:hypothetical protein